MCGSLFGTDTRSGLAAGVKRVGVKVMLPRAYTHFSPTSIIYQPLINLLVENGVLEGCAKSNVKCIHSIFGVYKSDTHCRVVYDMSMLSVPPDYVTPPFSLPTIKKVLADVRPGELAIKFDLNNRFYHLPVHPQGRRYFGIKCGSKYYRFKRLPMGWAGFPFYYAESYGRYFLPPGGKILRARLCISRRYLFGREIPPPGGGTR